jgi:hypothetical protein
MKLKKNLITKKNKEPELIRLTRKTRDLGNEIRTIL